MKTVKCANPKQINKEDDYYATDLFRSYGSP